MRNSESVVNMHHNYKQETFQKVKSELVREGKVERQAKLN